MSRRPEREPLPEHLANLEALLTSGSKEIREQGISAFFALSPEDTAPFKERGIFLDPKGRFDGFASVSAQDGEGHWGTYSASARGLAAGLRLAGEDPRLQAAAEACFRGSKKGVVQTLRDALPLLAEDPLVQGLVEDRIRTILAENRQYHGRRRER